VPDSSPPPWQPPTQSQSRSHLLLRRPLILVIRLPTRLPRSEFRTMRADRSVQWSCGAVPLARALSRYACSLVSCSLTSCFNVFAVGPDVQATTVRWGTRTAGEMVLALATDSQGSSR
jgi:hypothetical protein